MMITRRVFPIALAMGMGLGWLPAPSEAAKVKDGANMFSASAIQAAEEKLGKLERQYQIPIEVETIPSLNGKKIGDALKAIANAEGRKGMFVLISKADKKIECDVSGDYAYAFPFGRTVAIRDGFTEGLKKSRGENFDPGLEAGVSAAETFVARSAKENGGTLQSKAGAPRAATVPAAPRPAAPTPAPRVQNAGGGSGLRTLIGIVILIVGVMFVIRIVRGLFGNRNRMYGGPNQMGAGPGYGGPAGGPGYGGPGYGYGGGGGGGGFWSSMFGGIGGAMAGNWIYDQMTGRRHESYGQTNYDPGQAPAPEAPQETQWVGSGEGDWGGGDQGGGGGGDWGGGGGDGGGDWSGGGGGDDQGGSW